MWFSEVDNNHKKFRRNEYTGNRQRVWTIETFFPDHPEEKMLMIEAFWILKNMDRPLKLDKEI